MRAEASGDRAPENAAPAPDLVGLMNVMNRLYTSDAPEEERRREVGEFSLGAQTISEEALAIAERIRTNIAEAAFPHRRVTLSIGVASCSAELCLAKNIVSAADQALYQAKRNGRNRVQAYENMGAETSVN